MTELEQKILAAARHYWQERKLLYAGKAHDISKAKYSLYQLLQEDEDAGNQA